MCKSQTEKSSPIAVEYDEIGTRYEKISALIYPNNQSRQFQYFVATKELSYIKDISGQEFSRDGYTDPWMLLKKDAFGVTTKVPVDLRSAGGYVDSVEALEMQIKAEDAERRNVFARNRAVIRAGAAESGMPYQRTAQPA